MQAASTVDPTELCTRIRRHCVNMTHRAGASHVGSNLSTVEILTTLYTKILRVDPSQPTWADRDRFILSKGHACAGYYAVLAETGFFPVEWLETFYQNGAILAGHASHARVPGIEISTGSLGHGFSMAAGMALAARRDGKSHRVFALLGDGECDEGAVWECALFGAHHELDNFIAIIDYNKIQSLGSVAEVMKLEPFAAKWRDFGWAVQEIDGHDLGQIEAALSTVPHETGRPTCIVAHTVKGKGVSFMENQLLWHYRSPHGQEYEAAMAELETGR